jgi:hypothetical protein
MKTICVTAALFTLALSPPALAQQSGERLGERPAIVGQRSVAQQKLGDHPAVVVQRLWAKKGFDYESTFYPHPAWLYLRTQAPPAEPNLAANSARPRQPPPTSEGDRLATQR